MKPWGLHSRRVIVNDQPIEATVVVQGETFQAVVPGPKTQLARDVPITDYRDAVIMAGLCDTHVHLNEPGRTSWEGFETGTRAAAAGGVTSLVDMPLNCLPVTTTASALAQKLQAATPKLWVDAGFWAGVVPDNAADLPELARAGALGAKAFMCDSGIPEFPAVGEPELRRAMQALSASGLPLLAHAELECKAASQGDPQRYQSYLASRPADWEEAAIELLIRLCRETGCAVHVVHLSAASALPALSNARRAGLPITVETCPHYLTLCAEDIADGRTEMKCAPPIRERENRERLWAGLRDSTIDMVTSDHSPCAPQLKRREEGDFQRAWGGISSLQLGLPLLWTEARKRGFSLGHVARWLAAAPASVAGLEAHKGRLDVGLDADVVVWDPDAQFVVEAQGLYARHKLNPYLGRELTGVVRATYLRGQCVFRDALTAAQQGAAEGPSPKPMGRVLKGRAEREDKP